MIRSTIFWVITYSLFTGIQPVSGQPLESDSVHRQKSVASAYAFYAQSMATHARLYNGSEYVDYDRSIIGHQYFRSDDWENGSVYYDGTLFRDVPLLYDIRLDKVITENFAGPFQIQLVSEKVTYFTLLGHTFVRLLGDTAQNADFQTGFYDRLYYGKVQVLAKRMKHIEERIESGKVTREFKSTTRYFIHRAGTYYLVRSKQSVLKVFDDRRTDIQRHLRRNKIRFRRDRETAIVQMAQHYDVLSSAL